MMERLRTQSEFNPYAAPDLPIERPSRPPRSDRQFVLKVLSFLQTLTLLLGLGAMFIQIETIMGSGLIYCVIGLLIMILGMLRKVPIAIMFGGQAVAYAFFIFGLIAALSWAPNEADMPVKIISIGYTLIVALPVFAILLTKIR